MHWILIFKLSLFLLLNGWLYKNFNLIVAAAENTSKQKEGFLFYLAVALIAVSVLIAFVYTIMILYEGIKVIEADQGNAYNNFVFGDLIVYCSFLITGYTIAVYLKSK